MTANEVARAVKRWTESYHFCGDVEMHREFAKYVVEFTARTTKTRASSMVTRVGLIVAEVIKEQEFEVGKELMSDPPKDRAALSTWRIYVNVPVKPSKKIYGKNPTNLIFDDPSGPALQNIPIKSELGTQIRKKFLGKA